MAQHACTRRHVAQALHPHVFMDHPPKTVNAEWSTLSNSRKQDKLFLANSSCALKTAVIIKLVPARFVALVLAGATLIAASVLSLLLIDRWLPSPSHLQIGAYEAAWGANNGTAQRPIDLFRRALKGDPASPYRWSDLAEALAANGDITKSR